MPNHVENIIQLRGDQKRIREMLEQIKDDDFGIGTIDFQKVIPMPASLDIISGSKTHTTDISVTLWIINKNKKARVVEQNGQLKRYRNREKEILFMDLRQMGSPYEKKYIELTEDDRAKVTGVYHAWQQEGYEETYENVPEFCYSASLDEVAEKGYTLVPSRYIEFVNRDENIDFDTKMKTLQSELKELLVAEEKSKADLLSVFKELGYEIEL